MGSIKKEHKMKTVFREILHEGLKQEVSIKKVLVEKKSLYQKIQIFDKYLYKQV